MSKMALGVQKWVFLKFLGISVDTDGLGIVENHDLAENSIEKLTGDPFLWSADELSCFYQTWLILGKLAQILQNPWWGNISV